MWRRPKVIEDSGRGVSEGDMSVYAYRVSDSDGLHEVELALPKALIKAYDQREQAARSRGRAALEHAVSHGGLPTRVTVSNAGPPAARGPRRRLGEMLRRRSS